MKSINKSKEGVSTMFKPKFKFTHDEIRIIVMALVELKNSNSRTSLYLREDTPML